MPDPRGRLLRAALGFAGCSMPSYDRALHALGSWLDSWAGIGHVAFHHGRQILVPLELYHVNENRVGGLELGRSARLGEMKCES
jgi:hypothetical protein